MPGPYIPKGPSPPLCPTQISKVSQEQPHTRSLCMPHLCSANTWDVIFRSNSSVLELPPPCSPSEVLKDLICVGF